MNNPNSLDPHIEIMIDTLSEVLSEDCGIIIADDDNANGGNCSLSEFSELLTEIETHFSGDIDAALAAIRCGDLKFHETQNMDCGCESGCWAWHIRPTIQ